MPPADASSLQALARRHGIALAYHDIRGSERAAPEATLRALLAAMGVDPAQADAAFSRRVLAPAIVAPAREQPVRISVTLPESRTRETLR